jgi:hypothetical protein
LSTCRGEIQIRQELAAHGGNSQHLGVGVRAANPQAHDFSERNWVRFAKASPIFYLKCF